DVGDEVTLELNWDRRHKHMRMHTCMHILCSLVAGDVTGGQVGVDKSRLDFNLPESPDKEKLQKEINRVIAENHPVSHSWISDAELDASPELVRTMSVSPPRGSGRVRIINIDGVDLQPCGGTHVKETGEIGLVRIGKIENKGKQNRRINIHFA
ncbi:MAG: alanyl-tRNA editing protein, partial [Rhodospirillaceae bacterium]|nr:alanyl-tRNA editing protein [Rhodospirillaceae bacterium]